MRDAAPERCADDRSRAVQASWMGLAAALVVLLAAPSSGFAWKWSGSTCTSTTSKTFETVSPEAYLMLDRSGSMNFCMDGSNDEGWECSDSYYCCNDSDQQSRWQVATAAIDATVNDLVKNNDPPPVEFGFGQFSGGDQNDVTPGNYTNGPYQDISAVISDDYAGGGGTNMHEGINRAESVLSGTTAGAQKATIFITDGEPNPDTDDEAINAACNTSHALYSVGFGSGADQPFNNALAAAGGTGVCCSDGTGAANCTKSHANYVDICSMSWDDLQDADYGRSLDCKGAYQVNTGTGLKSAINEISNDLSCTIDASTLWDPKWSDAWYDCAPTYDCMQMNVPGGLPSEANDTGGNRLYHQNSSHSTSDWWWAFEDPAVQDQLRLSTAACEYVKGLTDKTVDVKRACMCGDRTYDSAYQERTCTVSNPGVCQCTKGDAGCQQGVNSCDPYEAIDVTNYSSNWDPSDDSDFVVGTHCHPDDINGKGGQKCTGCTADEDTKAPQCNPANVTECREFLENSTASETCVRQKPGRCSKRVRYCQKDGTWGTCKQVYRAVPEICNGLDDDCDGEVDDIAESWNGTGEAPQDEPPTERWDDWNTPFEGFAEAYRARSCGMSHACRCPDGAESHQGTGLTREEEFRNMVDNTTTSCMCAE